MKYKKSLLVSVISIALIATAAKAFVPALIAPLLGGLGAGASALVVEAGGYFTAANIGAAVIGSSIAYTIVNVDVLGVAKKVIIAGRNMAFDSNPDLETTPAIKYAASYAPNIGGVPYSYLSFAATPTGSSDWDMMRNNGDGYASGNGCAKNTVCYSKMKSRMQQQLAAYGFNAVFCPEGANDTNNDNLGSCPARIFRTSQAGYIFANIRIGPADGSGNYARSSTAGLPSGVILTNNAKTAGGCGDSLLLTGGTATVAGCATLVFSVSASNILECESGSSYNFETSSCLKIMPSESLEDGVCNLTWSEEQGSPIRNPFDKDCAALISTGQLQVSPGGPSMPPSVSVVDKTTGKTTTVERPVLAAQVGTNSAGVGGQNISEAIPNVATGTNTKNITIVAPGSTAGARPVATGSAQKSYNGTAPPSATAAPISTVSVTNWPTLVNVTGSVTCSNCTQTQAAAPAPIVNINTPDTMKINNEGHNTQEMPDPSGAIAELEGKDWLAALKEKVNPFSAFKPPSQAGNCPALAFDWSQKISNSGTQNDYISWSVSNNTVCEVLEKENVKLILQGGMLLLFALAGIKTVLGA